MLDARDLLGRSSDLPQVFCPSLLCPAADHMQFPRVLVDSNVRADPRLEHTGEMIRLLGSNLRAVERMDRNILYRTSFLDPDDLPTVKATISRLP